MSGNQRRQAVVFPKEQKILQQLGENIRLAMKRRKLTQTMIAERTGLSKPTLRNIERGESTVSIGHYLRVLAVLGLAEDLANIARDDVMGRKLQDIALLKTTKSGTKPTADKVGPTSRDNARAPNPKSAAQAEKPGSSQRIQSLMALAKSRSQNESGLSQQEQDSRPQASSKGDDA